MTDTGNEDTLDIPAFLKRTAGKAAATVQSEGQMTEEIDTTADAPAPAKAKAPRKATAKPNGGAKPAKAKAAAPKAAKPASKPAKAKAKAAKTAKAPAKAKAKASKVERDAYGFKVGTLKAQAAAMYASKKGATLGEVKAKLDSVQLNLLTKLEAEGFKVSKVKEDGPGNRKVTRYFLRAK